MNLKEFINSSGEIILYNGTPNFEILEKVSLEYGDIWHSSFEQGYKNAFPEVIYQTPTFWYINDFDNLNQCVSWRINPYQFAIRKSVWDFYNGFTTDYQSVVMSALDFGYNGLCYKGIIPLYIKSLFISDKKENLKISLSDKYGFFVKNFKSSHSNYMFFRSGYWKPNHILAYLVAKKKFNLKNKEVLFPPRKLVEIKGEPTVTYIIPTMLRQDFTLNLLNDLVNQTYKVSQVIVVDATPIDKRDESLYSKSNYPFKVIFKWQETKGSCRARNEAITMSTGDYIVFGDDDVRLPSNFIENHIRLLQTYNAKACNGLDLQADNLQQDLNDLQIKLEKYDSKRWRVGVTNSFSNANSCVKKEAVDLLIGNDVNYDGGYGEDSDFGISLTKIGIPVLHNPFSANLHLKPPIGGYRFWGTQAKIIGKKRKKQPWEFDTPVKKIVPVPSPTITYQILKQFNTTQLKEFKFKYLFMYIINGSKLFLIVRLFKLPYKIIQFNKSIFYAKKLIKIGKRTE